MDFKKTRKELTQTTEKVETGKKLFRGVNHYGNRWDTFPKNLW